ncbi:MAG: methyltransferase domain-containing protein [Lachnospiraceae bacterium]|nr:methyltransferase domain-containing protein [Lachnospiraceae bacterium]
MLEKLQPWEALLKRMLWTQLGDIQNKKILDFGSGIGVTANYYAKNNEVIAVEPSEDSVKERCTENDYQQIVGSTDELRKIADESFDVIFCHNVLEYATDREDIIKEFYRLLKPNGILSIVKHNRPGRVMQMVVLLNNFESANSLLDGNDGTASQYGVIHYYNDEDITKWCKGFSISKVHGIRTFWDLQQNQEIHKDAEWQEKMLQVEMRVADIEEYQNIAFFHHLLLTK